jgi:predicted nucleic acid-binding protein
MKRLVLDASALISYFENRAGGDVVEEVMAGCIDGKNELFMSIVNWGEVYYSAWRAAGEGGARRLAAEISQFPIQLVDADFELTKSAAALHAKYNLPYADCFAAALSKDLKAQLITGDRDFEKVQSEIKIKFL